MSQPLVSIFLLRAGCAAPAQPAKTALAGGNEADVRKTAYGRFSNL
jgi:hypothetical protein